MTREEYAQWTTRLLKWSAEAQQAIWLELWDTATDRLQLVEIARKKLQDNAWANQKTEEDKKVADSQHTSDATLSDVP